MVMRQIPPPHPEDPMIYDGPAAPSPHPVDPDTVMVSLADVIRAGREIGYRPGTLADMAYILWFRGQTDPAPMVQAREFVRRYR